jgi:glyoxylase-like metal-dependent hydrolase (beta-lactamase superfamily II)
MKITDDIYWYSKDKPFGNILLRGNTCNVFAINQGNEIWLVDTGVKALGRAKRIIKLMKKDGLDPSKISKIFVTHAHADHINGVPVFKALSNPEILVYKDDKVLFEGGYEYIINEQFNLMIEFHYNPRTVLPVPKPIVKLGVIYSMGNMPHGISPDVLLQDNQIVHGPKYDMQVLHTPGHTVGHVCYYIPQLKALFIGDLLDPYYSEDVEGIGYLVKPPINLVTSDYEGFCSSIERLLKIDIDLLLCAHARKMTYTGIEENRQIVLATKRSLEYAKARTIELLKAHPEGMTINNFSGKYPKRVWTLTDQKAVPFCVLKSLLAEKKVNQDGIKFTFIG